MKPFAKLFTGLLVMFFLLQGSSLPSPPLQNKGSVDSLDIKIGQMIMIGLGDLKHLADTDRLAEELRLGRLGGVVLFEKNIDAGNPSGSLIQLNATLQRNAGGKLFIGIDEEGGRVHRLKEKYGFVAMPSAEYLGKLNNTDSTYFYNLRLANELALLGFNMNFAPCVDLAVNPENPVIVKNKRSYGSDPKLVTLHASHAMGAMNRAGIIPVIKHFPGHGSSLSDTHLGISDISSTWSLIEVQPFLDLFNSGICKAVMSGHLVNGQIDTALPSTLSYATMNGLLRDGLNFKGVTFSDDMQMMAISNHFGPETAIALAINAGVDVLMFANNTPGAGIISATRIHNIIRQLVMNGVVKRSRIDEAYKRIVELKATLK